MRQNCRDYDDVTSRLHWHDGDTCHGHSTPEACVDGAISSGWVGRVLERVDVCVAGGEPIRCYSLVSGSYDYYAKRGRFVAEVKMVALDAPTSESRRLRRPVMVATVVGGVVEGRPISPGDLAMVEVPDNCTIHSVDAARLARMRHAVSALARHIRNDPPLLGRDDRRHQAEFTRLTLAIVAEVDPE